MDNFRLFDLTRFDWLMILISLLLTWIFIRTAKAMDHFHHGIIRRLRENPPRRCYTHGYALLSDRPYMNRTFPKRSNLGIPLVIALACMLIAGNIPCALILTYALYRDVCYHYRYQQYKRTYELTET